MSRATRDAFTTLEDFYFLVQYSWGELSGPTQDLTASCDQGVVVMKKENDNLYMRVCIECMHTI